MSTTTPLRTARIARGLSQQQAADLVGLSQSAWSRVESGKTMPQRETLLLISRQFDVPVTQILSPDASAAA